MVLLIILIVLILLYVFLLIPRLPRRDMSALTKVDYAHRGLWNVQRPENSLSAFRSAVDAGYGIELDVHRTKDGVLVVHHDDNLKRVCGVDRWIAQSTLADVRACHLSGTDEVVPTFDEVLEAVGGRVPLIVELKVEQNVDSLCSAEGARLGRSVQFSDTGLYPAQADHAKHLDAASLGVPVLAAGIPTLMESDEGADLVVTPRALDSVIAHGSALLAGAINRALQPRLSLTQLCWLTG